MQNNQTAARAARRILADRVRTDWDWPNPPPYWSASDEEVRGVTEFRERYYGTETSPSSTEEEEETTEDQPYKFDSPDSLGVVRDRVEERTERRKRRRREDLWEEMRWNEGLKVWVRRRDVWTGAASVRRFGAPGHGQVLANGSEVMRAEAHKKGEDVEMSDAPADTTTTTEEVPANTTAVGEPPTSMPDQDSTSAQSAASVPFANPTEPDPDLTLEPLVPLATPLLPDNPIRNSISPRIYPEIYQKVVVSSRTPAVPINLSDMTRALVQGWKDTGEWPPRSGPLDPLAGRRKSAALAAQAAKANGTTHSHHGFLGLALGGHGHHGGENGMPPHEEGRFLEHHPHVRKGVESVKRILHLSPHESGVGEQTTSQTQSTGLSHGAATGSASAGRGAGAAYGG